MTDDNTDDDTHDTDTAVPRFRHAIADDGKNDDRTRREVLRDMLVGDSPVRAAHEDGEFARVGDALPPQEVTIHADKFETVKIVHDGETYRIVETADGLAIEPAEADK